MGLFRRRPKPDLPPPGPRPQQDDGPPPYGSKPSRARKAPAARRVTVTLLDRGGELKVTGTSRCQDAIEEVVGPKGEDAKNHELTVLLVPDGSNPYDSNAIKVMLATGKQCGWVPKDVAAQWHKPLVKLAKRSGRPVAATAYVTGGWKRSNGDEGHFGVRLDVDPQELR